MNTQYRHSQPGYLMIVIGVIMLVVATFVYAYGLEPLGIILGASGIFILVFGYKLAVEIKDGFLRFWFGPGIFWKKIALEQIAYCQPFKGIIFGWGIRITGDGWLYNVSGMKAVTIVLKSGKKLHIGTDEPERLIEAINFALHGSGGGEAARIWTEVKADYLKRVEQALSAVRHPRSFEILADIGGHLERRFAELVPGEHTWESFQKIITEMGPPSDYAELIGANNIAGKTPLLSKFTVAITLILIAVATGMIILPKALRRNEIPPTKRPASQSPYEQETTAAIESAKSWLQLIDEGNYGESWAQAAEYFRANVSEDQWKRMVEPVRKPLGNVLSREVKTSTYTTEAPGAPDGHYVIIQFDTSFENKRSAVETVTPMLDSDGLWRVSGYYIR
jgi:uncharacterized membrane protein